MKRKKNSFLVLWTLVLVGLSSFALQVHGVTNENINGIDEVALFCNGRWAYTKPANFDPLVPEYTADVPVEIPGVTGSPAVYLAIKFTRGGETAIPVTVRIGTEVQKALDGSNSSEASLPKGYQKGSYDSVYVVNLGVNVGDKLTGTLTFGNSSAPQTYTLTVTRVRNLDIANLKTLFVDSEKDGNREKSDSFNPEFDPQKLTGAYSDTLKVSIDSSAIATKFTDLLTDATVTADFAALGVEKVELKTEGITVTPKQSGIAGTDTVKITNRIDALIRQAVGAASDAAIEAKDYRLNFEMADPWAEVEVKVKGDDVQEETDVNFGADKTSFSILPRYTYTFKVTSQSKDSTGTFTFKAESKVTVGSFKPVVKVGTVEKPVEGIDEGDLDAPYGPRVDSIWLESLEGVHYSVNPAFHEDTLFYKAGISASSSYALVFASSSGEPDVERKPFTLRDEEGNTYYELRIYVGKEREKTYTVRTYFLDSITALQSLVLSYDAEKKDVIDFEAPGFGAAYSSFVSKAVKHDKDSVYLHIVPGSKKSKVKVSGDTDGNRLVTDSDSLIVMKIKTDEEGKEYRIAVDLTAEDKSSRQYTVRIPKSFDLSLDSVAFGVSTGDAYKITPRFDGAWDSDSGTYKVTVPATVEFKNVRLVYSEKPERAVVNTILEHKIDGTYDYIVRVAVPGYSGEKDYSFSFVYPHDNADLRSLNVVPGSLDRVFAPEDTFYTVTLPLKENKIVVVAFASDSLATIKGDKITGTDFYSESHTLKTTVDTLSITVTAEDGVSKQVYLIEVRRDGSTGIASVAPASNVYVSGGVLYVDTPEAERISVYTAGGQQLSGVSKPAGRISFAGLRGLLIVRGSSGWVKKVLI